VLGAATTILNNNIISSYNIMASLREYIPTNLRGLQHVCALIEYGLGIPNYVVPDKYYAEQLENYTPLCIREIRSNTKIITQKNKLKLVRLINPNRITEDNTLREPDEALWFFNNSNKSNKDNLEFYDRAKIYTGQIVSFTVKNIKLIDFTGKDRNEIEQELMNIKLMRAIFDYLYYKLKIWKKSRSDQKDFNMYKRMFGYNNGTRISTFKEDRIIVEIILNDDVISKLIQGYFCSQVKNGMYDGDFHEEYCVLQKYCFGMSDKPNDLEKDTFIDNTVERGYEGNYFLKGGNPQQKLINNLIFDPNGEEEDPINTFLKKYENIIQLEIEDKDEIDDVMLYIIDPHIREIVRNGIIEINKNSKKMNTIQKTKIEIPHIYNTLIPAYGGNTKRRKKYILKKQNRRSKRNYRVKTNS
jgi:hypothetical protein